MAKWRIDTLTPQEIAKYRQRSFDAINGIEYLLKYANVIAQYEKISDKYKTIAEYIGLGQEGGNSIPYTIIVDNKGAILAKDLRGEELQAFVAERLD